MLYQLSYAGNYKKNKMRVKGLEPPRRKALDPKSSASANSATPAYTYEPYWARTSDPLIKSQMLYQLS